MYQALYRKYRPTNFDEVVGQKTVVKTLVNAIENNRITHAYIFSGPRGTGKTSIAKIFAKTINCENPKMYIPCNKCSNCIDYNNKKTVDIIEIDAASNNGVDEIRNLKNSVNLVPNSSKYKVYIIDEVHMLSTSAFNALLKTLEEPPKYVIFILATTELYKVPETIVSRCQNFEFERLSNTSIIERLLYISNCENIKIDETALKAIAQYSNGGMRDAISLLDQLSSYKNDMILLNDVEDICGLVSSEQIFELIDKLVNNNLKDVLNKLIKYNDDGKNLLILFEKIVDVLKDLLIYNNASDYFSDDNLKEKLEVYSSKIEELYIYDIINELTKSINNMKYENNKLILAQLCIIKINSMLNETKKTLKEDVEENIKNISQEIKVKNFKDNNNNNNNNNWEIINLPNYIEFKNRRINNTLALFNKKDLISFKKQLKILNDYISNEQYGSVVSLLLDGELKAKGECYIIYVYNDQKMSELFNNTIKSIEEFMSLIFNDKYKMISVTLEEWNDIKIKFNNGMKNGKNNYEIKKDIELQIPNSNDSVVENNNIDNMFSEIVKYE